jgi:hypothetical protein
VKVSITQQSDLRTGAASSIDFRRTTMSRIARIAVFIAALTSLLAVMSTTAGAVTWTNTGATAVHATTGHGALHVGSNALTCQGGTAIGTAPAHSAASTYAVTGTITFTPCTLAGQATFIDCNYTLTGINWASGVTAGSADVTCEARLHAGTQLKLCHISGSTPYSYNNSTGALTLSQSSSLIVANGVSVCPLGTGTGTLTEQTFNTTAANRPVITRHP